MKVLILTGEVEKLPEAMIDVDGYEHDKLQHALTTCKHNKGLRVIKLSRTEGKTEFFPIECADCHEFVGYEVHNGQEKTLWLKTSVKGCYKECKTK